MSATDTFTLRVCISGLCLIIPTKDGRLKVLMPRTGGSHPTPMQHQARMRFDIGHLGQGGSPTDITTVTLDDHTIIVPDGVSGQNYAWADDGLLDLSTTFGPQAGPPLLNATPGNEVSCVVTVPPGFAQCVAHGNWWKVKGAARRVSWLLRRDIQFDTSSVTIFGQTLYPFADRRIDVTIVNEPTSSMLPPAVGDPMPHMKGLFVLLGVNDSLPTFCNVVDPGEVCDGWIGRPHQLQILTDAFQCMPAVATPV